MSYFVCHKSTAEFNTDFRRVIFTSDHIQAILMSVPAGQEIGEEVHDEHDQTFVAISGEGKLSLGEEEVPLQAGDMAVVPKGVYHNLRNLGTGPLQLYSFCSPPHHPPGTVHPDKLSALAAQEH
jgi:mannose-6-phosphate isomerase-like protein (cupin superfamily)